MKKIYLLLLLPLTLYAQTFTLTVQNQTVNGSEFNFDIYMLRTGVTEIYLGTCDFVVTFNNANFTSPSYVVVQRGDVGSNLNTWYSASPTIVSSNRAVLNVQQPGISDQTEFDNRVQVISNSGSGTLIAKVKITGISNSSGTANIQWRTDTPNNTDIISLANTDPWNGTNISSNGIYTDPPDAPLPVELSSFTASVKKNIVSLQWQTQTEVNNYGFEVERRGQETEVRSQKSEWVKIGFVTGNGNSNSPKNYSFTDKNLTGGSEFTYRLKQVDNDGIYSYSIEVQVEVVPARYELYQNYPNPFNPLTNIKFSLPEAAKVKIEVFNIIGEKVITLIEQNMEAGFHSITFNAENLSSGTYIYRLQTENFTQIKKMLLLK